MIRLQHQYQRGAVAKDWERKHDAVKAAADAALKEAGRQIQESGR
jgi:hypothetical protein